VGDVSSLGPLPSRGEGQSGPNPEDSRRRPPLARGRTVPAIPGATSVEAGQTVGEAALAVLRKHFAAFLAHQEGTRRGKDPEELHQMRVASRRVRAAVALFKESLPPGGGRLRQDLRWIGARLGRARDADVQIEQVRAWLAAADRREREIFRPLLAILQEQRAQARVPMLRALDSLRYRRFIAAYMAFVRRPPGRRVTAARRQVLAAAPDLIGHRFRAARKAGDGLGPSSAPAKLHALRIKCKRLRYAVESFADLYGEPAATFVKRLARLQDLLGLQQDGHVAIARLRRLCETQGRRLPPRTLFAMGRAAQRYAQQGAEARSAFPQAYRRIIGKRWKRLRDAVERRRRRAASNRR
jgi:CHAD domain-containing protein